MTVAAFQSAVQILQGFGVPGELFTDSPWIAESYILDSAETSYNVIGATAYTVASQGVAQAGSGGSYGFAGILADPKNQALIGDGANPLNPSLTLPNYVNAVLVTMGTMIVTLPNTANVGDFVWYNTTTGALSSTAPQDTPPTDTLFANAIVKYYFVGSAGLAVIQINPYQPSTYSITE